MTVAAERASHVRSRPFRLLLLGLCALALWHVGFGLSKFLLDDGDSAHNRITAVYSVAFSQDGRTLASANTDKVIETWDVARSRFIASRGIPLNSQGAFGKALITSDGHFVTWDVDRRTRIWRLADGTLSDTIDTDVVIAISPDHGLLIDRSLRLWNTESGQVLRNIDSRGGLEVAAALSPDGRFLAEGSKGVSHTFRIWSVSDGRLVGTLERPSREEGRECDVRILSFSPDGRTIASVDLNDPEVDLWDVTSGSLVQKLEQYYRWCNVEEARLCDEDKDGESL